MSLVSMRCPNCNGDISVDDSCDYGFCMYCGTKVMIRTTVKVKVVNDGINGKENLLKRIDGNISRRRFNEARSLCKDLLNKYPETKLSEYGLLKTDVEEIIYNRNSETNKMNNEDVEKYEHTLTDDQFMNMRYFEHGHFEERNSTEYRIFDLLECKMLEIDESTRRIKLKDKEHARQYVILNPEDEIIKVLLFDNCDNYINSYVCDLKTTQEINKSNYINKLNELKNDNDFMLNFKNKYDELQARINYLLELQEKSNSKNVEYRKKLYHNVINALDSYVARKLKLEGIKTERMKKSIPAFVEMVKKGDGLYYSGWFFYGSHGQLHVIACYPSNNVHAHYFDYVVKKIDEEGNIYTKSRKEPLAKTIEFTATGEVSYDLYPIPRKPVPCKTPDWNDMSIVLISEFADVKLCPFCLGKLRVDVLECRCKKCSIKFNPASRQIYNLKKF